jgi:hypothetical protein
VVFDIQENDVTTSSYSEFNVHCPAYPLGEASKLAGMVESVVTVVDVYYGKPDY